MIKYFSRTAVLLAVTVIVALSLFSSAPYSIWSFLTVQEPTSAGALVTNVFPMDRFGNRLSWEEISTESSTPSTVLGGGGCSCQNDDGLFDIIFEDVCQDRDYGFDDPVLGPARQEVVCRVFADLSVLLDPTGTISPNRVELIVQASEGTGVNGDVVDALAAGTVAAATPVIFSGFSDGLAMDMCMRAIQSNSEPYAGLTFINPNIDLDNAHALLRVNFAEFDFFLNTNPTDLTPANLHDLYTVTLHEALHMLGMYSLIDAEASNQSTLASQGAPGVYSQYDTYIRTINGTNLTSNGTSSYINYPTAVPYMADVATDNLVQSPLCSADAEFSGNAQLNQALYLPFPWKTSGLSHLNCDDQNIPGDGCALDNGYVMNECGPPGYNQRHPAQEEVNILCDLGYTLAVEYGTQPSVDQGGNIPYSTYATCTGNQCEAIGLNDILFDPFIAQTNGPSLDVAAAEFLSNDINAAGYISNSFQMVETNISVGTIADLGGGTGFTFTPSGNVLGWVTARYLPQCADGSPGDWAYIFFQIEPEGLDAQPCPSTEDCNLICDGSFEGIFQGTDPSSHYDYKISQFGENLGFTITPNPYGVDGGYDVSGFESEFCGELYPGGILLPEGGTGATYIGFESTISNMEGWEFKLREPLDPNKMYRLSFLASSGCDITANFGFSINKACPVVQDINIRPAVYEFGTVNCDGYTYSLSPRAQRLIPSTVNNTTGFLEWQEFEIDITPNEASRYLLLYMDLPPLPTEIFYAFFDDIRLVEVPNPPITVEHEIEDTPCPGEIIDIPITVCSDELPTDPVLLSASFQSLLLNFVNGGDFTNGIANLTNFTPEGGQFCQTVTLQVQIDASTPLGSSFEIFIDSDGACITTTDDYLIEFEVQDVTSDPNFTTSFDVTTCELTLTPDQVEGTHEWSINGSVVSTDVNPTTTVNPGSLVIEHLVLQEGQCTNTIASETLGLSFFELIDVSEELIDTPPLCPGDVVDIVIEYCFDSDPVQFTLDAQLPGSGLILGPGGDFASGPVIVTGFSEIEGLFCQSVTLQVEVEEISTAGVSFPIDMVISENCRVSRTEYEFTLDVFEENLDAGFTFQIDEENCLLTLIPNDLTGPHSWLVDGTEASTDASPVLSLDPNVYNITHVVTGECETAETTQTIDMTVCSPLTVFECPCEGPNAINLDAGDGEGMTVSSFISNGTLPSNSVTNTCMAIRGRLIVDTDFFAVGNGEVKMQPGAEIYVQTGNVLILGSVNQDTDGDGVAGVHGCGQLWEGITAEARTPTEIGGTVTIANSIIQDAVHAVRLENGTQTYMFDNIFDRNHISVYVPPSTSLKILDQPVTPMRNNTFSCSADLLPAYTGQQTTTGLRSRSGVEVHDLKRLEIGNLIEGNTFSGMEQGIYADNSIIRVHRAEIHDMYGPAPDTDFTDQGVGVYLTNKAWLDMRRSKFYNLETAVFGHQITGIRADENTLGKDLANVEGNLIRGFDITPINNALVAIDDNQIYAQEYGILVSNAAAAGTLRITEGGVITLKPSPFSLIGRAGIKLQDALEAKPSSDALLHSNIITIEERGDGIVLSGVAGVTIADSEIVYESTVTAGASKYGILLKNANNNYLYNNYVEGASTTGNHHGIYIQGSVDNRLCCNTTTSTTFGIYFDGTCDGTRLRHNEFINNNTGLTCYLNTRIGTQNEAGNFWTGPFGSLAAAHYSTIQGDVFDSRFSVIPPSGTSIWPDPLLVFVASNDDWFILGGDAPTCASDNTCEEPDDNVVLDDEFATKVVGGQFYYGDYPVVSQWEAERSLYRNQKLVDPQSSGTWSTAIQQFFTLQSQQNSKVHAIGEVEDGLAALYERDATIADQQVQLGQFTEQLYLLDSTYWDGGLDSLAYVADRAGLQTKLQNAYESINLATQSIVQSQLSLAQSLSVNNANIALEHLALDNQLAVNDLYLQTIAAGEGVITTSQEQSLRSIAEQCPYSGGHAVYRAQAILEHYEKVYTESTCVTIQAVQGGNTDGEVPSTSITGADSNLDSTLEILAYPNPTDGKLFVDLPLKQGAWNVEILDIKGTVLKEMRDQSESIEVDLSQVPPGLYLIRCTSEDQVVSKRIIIQ